MKLQIMLGQIILNKFNNLKDDQLFYVFIEKIIYIYLKKQLTLFDILQINNFK